MQLLTFFVTTVWFLGYFAKSVTGYIRSDIQNDVTRIEQLDEIGKVVSKIIKNNVAHRKDFSEVTLVDFATQKVSEKLLKILNSDEKIVIDSGLTKKDSVVLNPDFLLIVQDELNLTKVSFFT